MDKAVICRICNKENKSIFSAKILNKYYIKYYYCSNCGFLQTEEPYWLQEAYNESINVSDTGIMSRNLNLLKISTLLIYFFFDKNKKFLDFAGGYGIFTRLMRDIGFDFYWYDKFSKNLVARGFEYNNSDSIELITSFESFEHFEQPMNELKSMLNISKNIIFSTELLPQSVPKPDDWSYYGLGHGQHISLYGFKTLEYIAKKYNLNLYSNKTSIHLLTKKIINNKLFNIILKANKLGIFHVIKKDMKSKTMDDWNLLR